MTSDLSLALSMLRCAVVEAGIALHFDRGVHEFWGPAMPPEDPSVPVVDVAFVDGAVLMLAVATAEQLDVAIDAFLDPHAAHLPAPCHDDQLEAWSD